MCSKCHSKPSRAGQWNKNLWFTSVIMFDVKSHLEISSDLKQKKLKQILHNIITFSLSGHTTLDLLLNISVHVIYTPVLCLWVCNFFLLLVGPGQTLKMSFLISTETTWLDTITKLRDTARWQLSEENLQGFTM